MKQNYFAHQSKVNIIFVTLSRTEIVNYSKIRILCLGKLQPYYDEDQEPIMDTDEIDSEEDIIMVGKPIQRVYHD